MRQDEFVRHFVTDSMRRESAIADDYWNEIFPYHPADRFDRPQSPPPSKRVESEV